MITGPRARWACLPVIVVAATLTFGVLAACVASPGEAGPSSLDTIPIPSGAVMDVGATGPGLDDGAPFVAFTSSLSPQAATAGYISDLARAGYRALPADDGWIRFVSGATTLRVRIGNSGPPTAIVVQMVTETPAGDTALPGSTALPSSEAAFGTPDPAHGPLGPRATPPTPAGNGTGNGGNGTGNGNGAGNGNGNGTGTAGGGGNGQGAGGGKGNGGAGNKPSPTPRPTKKPKPGPSADSAATPTPGKPRGVE